MYLRTRKIKTKNGWIKLIEKTPGDDYLSEEFVKGDDGSGRLRPTPNHTPNQPAFSFFLF